MSLGFKTKLLWFQNILKTVIWLKLGQDLKSFGRLKIGTLVTLKMCVKKFGSDPSNSDPFFIERHKLEFWHKPQIGVLYNWAYNFYAEFWAPLQTEWIWLNQSLNLVASSWTVQLVPYSIGKFAAWKWTSKSEPLIFGSVGSQIFMLI